MKKHFKSLLKIIIFIIFFTNINISFAETKASCQIKDGQPEILENYLKNLRDITSKIINQTNKTSNNSKSLAQAKSEMLGLYNAFTSWNNYSVEWDFWLKEPIFNNVPKEFYRDTKLLSNEIKKLDNIMSRLTKKGALKNKIDNQTICSGISNCNISNISGDALIQLVTSTRKVKELIQRAGANQKNDAKSCKNMVLINPNFCSNLYSIYKNAKNDCQDNKTEEKIKNISINFEFGDKGIKEWREAWALLIGEDTNKEKYNQLEKELLIRELDRQGVSAHQADQILKNLDEYNNNGGYSKTNNPISNIAKTVTNAIDPETKDEPGNFMDSIAEVFKKQGTKEVPISKLVELTKKNQKKNISKFDINKIYKEQLPLAQMEDLDSSQIVGKIIQMNNSIGVSINTLDGTIPLSRKVCNAQGQGDGICEY